MTFSKKNILVNFLCQWQNHNYDLLNVFLQRKKKKKTRGLPSIAIEIFEYFVKSKETFILIFHELYLK